MTLSHRHTYADLEALPYDEWNQYEIINGELLISRRGFVPHQLVCGEVLGPLMPWSDQDGRGVAVIGVCVVFSDSDVVIPDLIWVVRERARGAFNGNGHLTVAPELVVVEVLSPEPDNEWRDQELKRRLYSRQGVREYWIVDWQRREVQIYRRAGEALALAVTLSGDASIETPLLPGFSLSIARLWPPVL